LRCPASPPEPHGAHDEKRIGAHFGDRFARGVCVNCAHSRNPRQCRGAHELAGPPGAFTSTTVPRATCLEVTRGTHFPPHEPGRDGWAGLLRLVDDLRRLAHDHTLDDADRARRIRDRIGEHDGRFHDHD
jgi:hypothetical protein